MGHYQKAKEYYLRAYELSDQEEYKSSAREMEEKIDPNKKKGFFSRIFGWENIYHYLIHFEKSGAYLKDVRLHKDQTAVLELLFGVLLVVSQFVPEPVVGAGLLFIEVGEDGQIAEIKTYLELIKWGHDEVTLFMASKEINLLVLAYLDSLSLIGSLN